MPELHKTHIQNNKRGSQKPIRVVCTCGWSRNCLSFSEAKQDGNFHVQAQSMFGD